MPSGFLLIISAPSGTGKSTVCRKLLERDRTLRYSVSCSTRAPRPGEVDGKHYHFLTLEEFKKRIRSGEFLEWAVVHGNYYGTPKRFIERESESGRVVVLDVDVQGAASIKKRAKHVVTVFLLPPSWESLKERLRARKDARESVETRLANARKELTHAEDYDYLVVNDSLATAVKQVESIIVSERLRPGRHPISGVGVAEIAAVR